NGILSVSAKDVATGKQQQITITASSGLSKDEVERMVKEAESHAADDLQRRQEIELRNETDSLVYSIERALPEHGAKLTDDERRSVTQALDQARDALKGENADRIRAARDGLTRASQTMNEAMQRQPAGAGTEAGPASGG